MEGRQNREKNSERTTLDTSIEARVFAALGITVLFGKRQRAAQLETEKAFDKIEQ